MSLPMMIRTWRSGLMEVSEHVNLTHCSPAQEGDSIGSPLSVLGNKVPSLQAMASAEEPLRNGLNWVTRRTSQLISHKFPISLTHSTKQNYLRGFTVFKGIYVLIGGCVLEMLEDSDLR